MLLVPEALVLEENFRGELQPGWGRLLIKPRPQKTNFDEMPEVGARDTEASDLREVCAV